MRRPPQPAIDQTPEGHLKQDRLSRVMGYQIAQASVITTRSFNAEVRETLGLRIVEFTLLQLVHDNPGVTPARVAKALALTPASITMTVDRLAALGLVRREAGTADRRAQHLVLTPEGETVATDAWQRAQAGEAARLEPQLSPAEQAMLRELLWKLSRGR